MPPSSPEWSIQAASAVSPGEADGFIDVPHAAFLVYVNVEARGEEKGRSPGKDTLAGSSIRTGQTRASPAEKPSLAAEITSHTPQPATAVHDGATQRRGDQDKCCGCFQS